MFIFKTVKTTLSVDPQGETQKVHIIFLERLFTNSQSAIISNFRDHEFVWQFDFLHHPNFRTIRKTLTVTGRVTDWTCNRGVQSTLDIWQGTYVIVFQFSCQYRLCWWVFVSKSDVNVVFIYLYICVCTTYAPISNTALI